MKYEEIENFNVLIDDILTPVINKNREKIESIFKENTEFKSRVDEKVSEIMKARNNK